MASGLWDIHCSPKSRLECRAKKGYFSWILSQRNHGIALPGEAMELRSSDVTVEVKRCWLISSGALGIAIVNGPCIDDFPSCRTEI